MTDLTESIRSCLVYVVLPEDSCGFQEPEVLLEKSPFFWIRRTSWAGKSRGRNTQTQTHTHRGPSIPSFGALWSPAQGTCMSVFHSAVRLVCRSFLGNPCMFLALAEMAGVGALSFLEAPGVYLLISVFSQALAKVV